MFTSSKPYADTVLLVVAVKIGTPSTVKSLGLGEARVKRDVKEEKRVKMARTPLCAKTVSQSCDVIMQTVRLNFTPVNVLDQDQARLDLTPPPGCLTILSPLVIVAGVDDVT